MKDRTGWLRRAWPIAVLGVTGVAGLLLVESLGAGPVNRVLLYLPGVDKVLHFGLSFAVFHGLYFLAGRAGLPVRTSALGASVAALALAGFDEIQQGWSSQRSVEAGDVVAAGAGIVCGLASIAAVRRPRTAAVLAAAAMATAGAVTYSSYVRTKDYNRGLLLVNQGRLRDARLAYLRALDSGVGHADLYNGLAWTSVESGEGDLAQAVAYAERSLALRPGNSDTLDTYGWALYHAGRTDEAVGPLQQALALDPTIYCIHYHLGVVYLKQGRLDAARHHLGAQVERAPRSQEARLAAALLEATDWTGASVAR